MKLKWQFGESSESLEKEVNSIVGDATVEELLASLPAEIRCDDVNSARLTVTKLGDVVYQASYEAFRDVRKRNFERACIAYANAPSLRLALFELAEEVKKLKKIGK